MLIDTDRVRSDEMYRDELRFRCETDHFFLAELVGFTKFVPRLHQPVKDLYFPKNRTLPIEEQHEIKNRLHLDPRHTYKTTMGTVDTLQWVLAFPELITIVNESATQPLAKALSTQIAKFFWLPPWKSPTALQLLYPELLRTSKTEPEGEWNTPNHSDLEKDFTMTFTSPKTSQSGWHPWVLNPDDMVDTENSGIHATHESRQKVIDSYRTNRNTLRHGGFQNLRGTRYHPFDLYGDVTEKLDPAQWKVLIRASLRVKNGQRLLEGEFPEEDEVELLFPELLDYTMLRTLFFDHYESFMCQQQNDPQGGATPTFDEPLYQAAQFNAENIPVIGDTYLCWRFAYGGKDYMAQYAEGACARVIPGKVIITDCWQGRYTPSRLIEKVVRECRKHQTGKVMMEAVPGSEHFDAQLRNESYRRNHPIRIQWLDFEEDDNVRRSRLLQLEPQMRAGRVALSTSMTKAAECRRQFLHFGLVPENGIVDCISRLAAKIPASTMRQEIEEEEIELSRRRREDLMYQMAHGQAAAEMQAGAEEMEERERIKREASAYAWERANSLGLPPLPGGLDG